MSTNTTPTQRVIPRVEACIDCGGCEVACQRTWGLPEDSDRIRVMTVDEGEHAGPYQGGERSAALSCFHCAEAPCIEVCPTEAIERSDNDLVRVDKDSCIGCKYCAVACPFGAPQFPGAEVPEAEEEEPRGYGSAGLMDKCTGCEPRLEQDEQPACVSECPTDALIFGTPTELSAQVRDGAMDGLFSRRELNVIFGPGTVEQG